MANAAALIQESIWRDEHWRRLSRGAQALYMQLLSQKELDCAGVLPLQPNKWAKGCNELTVEQVWKDLEELQLERFVFFDTDTDETFVRTYMRNSNVMKVPNMRKSARRAALLVGSESIRPLLAVELRATGDPECIATADQINPSGNPSERVPVGSLVTLSEPLPEPTGVGTGTGVTHQSKTKEGEQPPRCSKHKENSDEPCHACARRREWDERNATAVAADDLDRKRVARAAAVQAQRDCPLCDDEGWVLGPDGTPLDAGVKCTAHERKGAAHA